MENIELYKNRFYNLMESKSGDVKPLLTELISRSRERDPDGSLALYMRRQEEANRKQEESNRKKQQYVKDLSNYNRDIILYDFWKNPNLTTEEINELQDLDRRLSGSGIKGGKKTILNDYKLKIYLRAFYRHYKTTQSLEKINLDDCGSILKKLVNNEINIEDFKPVKPINPSDEKKPSFKDRVKGFFGVDE